MVDIGSIRKLAEQIVQECHPERVILFGSYAYGTPTADSDVDLLVVVPCEGKGCRKAVEILNKVNPNQPLHRQRSLPKMELQKRTILLS